MQHEFSLPPHLAGQTATISGVLSLQEFDATTANSGYGCLEPAGLPFVRLGSFVERLADSSAFTYPKVALPGLLSPNDAPSRYRSAHEALTYSPNFASSGHRREELVEVLAVVKPAIVPKYRLRLRARIAVILLSKQGILRKEQVDALLVQMPIVLAGVSELSSKGQERFTATYVGLIEFLATNAPSRLPNIGFTENGNLTASLKFGKKARIEFRFEGADGGNFIATDGETRTKASGFFSAQRLFGERPLAIDWLHLERR